MIKVAPSILSADFMNLQSQIKLIEDAVAGYVHVDVMDGHFVPNLSIGVPVVKGLKKIDLFTVCNALIMMIVVLLSVYPLYYAVVNSLNDGTDTTNFGMVQLWPRQFSIDSWRMVVKDPAILTALGVTASRTVIVTVCQLIFTSMFAYAFSRPYLRFKKCYAALLVISIYIIGIILSTCVRLSIM